MPTTRIELVTSNYKLPILPTKLNRHFHIYIYIVMYILLIITYILMIFRRLERPLTQMKTEGFTIKLKDPRWLKSLEYIPGIEPGLTDYESVVRPSTLKYFYILSPIIYIYLKLNSNHIYTSTSIYI